MKLSQYVQVFVSLIGMFVFSGCYDSVDTKQVGKLTVVCTTGMIADAARTIGGQRVVVIGLMGPGVDPHLFRARPCDMHHIFQADILFYNGLSLEGKMIDVLCQLQHSKPCIALADRITHDQLVSTGFSDVYDPHIWHDVRLWICAVQGIIDELCALDPMHATEYCQRGTVYIRDLYETHEYVCQRVAQLPVEKKILVTAHDAFEYFGRAYGFQVIGLQGISTDVQIGIQDIQTLVDFIIAHNVHVMFIESSIIAKNLQAVQEAAAFKGHTVRLMSALYSDALGDDASGAGTYIDMMRANIDTIVDALSQD